MGAVKQVQQAEQAVVVDPELLLRLEQAVARLAARGDWRLVACCVCLLAA